ncbi:hypothetical protein NE865_02198 [Phthorimaea operculella]|nr:hypothetical protein NE865_02198 [Phthorimaea operculella]
MYIEAECPRSRSWFLCDGTLKHREGGQDDCIQHLITEQKLVSTYSPTSVTLNKEALEQLDERHYTLSFPKPTSVQISCNQEQYKTLQGSYLATIPQNCFIRTPEFTVMNLHNQIKGQVVKIANLPPLKVNSSQHQPFITLHSTNLENLHAMNTKITLQPQVKLDQVDNLSLYHTTIPIYVIILCTAAATIGITYRRLRTRQRKSIKPVDEPEPTYAKISSPLQQTNPSEIRVDTSKLPATFSKSLK